MLDYQEFNNYSVLLMDKQNDPNADSGLLNLEWTCTSSLPTEQKPGLFHFLHSTSK